MGAVDDYLLSVEDDDDRKALSRVFEVALEVIPDAEQGTGYRLPALKYRGKWAFAAYRAAQHIGLYSFSADTMAAVAATVSDIPGAAASPGVIRFDPGAQIPDDVIRALVGYRAAEIDG